MTGGSFPRLVVGAASSGAGKTTIACGLMAAFRTRGLAVQPFKAGPDYIDPGFHSLVTGREGRNLDTRLMSRGAVRELFRRAAGDADLSIVEGVMGLYDGAGAQDERGSTAHLAKVLRAPVLILLDVRAAARSAAALAWGFARFDRGLRPAGFILNRLGSPSHLAVVKEAVEAATGLPVFGGLFRDPDLSLPERSLVPSWETGSGEESRRSLEEYFSLLAHRIEASLDLEGILRAAREAPELPAGGGRIFGGTIPRQGKEPIIARALDQAFHFYYQDNLDILEHHGARVLPFSPLEDQALPPGTAGLYLGGGSPELYASGLAANGALLRAVRQAVLGGMPVLAEGAGLAYLARSLRPPGGEDYPMTGILPYRLVAEKKLQGLGYHDAELLRDSVLGRKGERSPGHLFHRLRIEEAPFEAGGAEPGLPGQTPGQVPGQEPGSALYRLSKPGMDSWTAGFGGENIAAGPLQLHFASRPGWARHFVRSCRNYAAKAEPGIRPGHKGDTQ